ncbi:MAG: class I SAM-dependent methyltransferase [Gemmatimonadales bacterium]
MTSRRDRVPFDARHFEKLARAGRHPEPLSVFRDIYRSHHWSGSESPSGAGAGTDQTIELRRVLPRLLRELGVGSMLDLPGGDYSWMRTVELPLTRYIGADLLPEVVAPLAAAFADDRREFRVLDLTSDPLPKADLLFCRDCLVHLSYVDIRRALANLLRSDIAYLLTTTFPAGEANEDEANEDIVTGDWRVLDLERAPFHLPPPVRILNEGCTEGGGAFADKSLGLWRTDDLRSLPFLTR